MRALVLALAACGGAAAAKPPAAPVARAVTAGDALLALLPDGADAVAEFDVARLRAAAPLADVLAALGKQRVSDFDPMADVDVIVAAVYHFADAGAQTVFVVRGDGLSRLPERFAGRAVKLDERTVVVGTRPAATGTLAADAKFLALRAQAMPAKAGGAIVRVTARLARPTRIAAAGKLGVDEVPATVSLWLDIADDAALVALLGGDDEADAVRLADLAGTAHARAAHWLPPWFQTARLAGDYTAKTAGRTARVVWLLGPRRLADWAHDAARRIQGGS